MCVLRGDDISAIKQEHLVTLVDTFFSHSTKSFYFKIQEKKAMLFKRDYYPIKLSSFLPSLPAPLRFLKDNTNGLQD